MWSLHPSYLDAKGLVALWREGLLARAVLRGETKGYRHHPQLERFRDHPTPRSAINHYLRAVADEAHRRGYRFDRRRIGPVRNPTPLSVTSGQLRFERSHLLRKLQRRAPDRVGAIPPMKDLRPHPLFRVRAGPPEGWERALPSPGDSARR